MTTVILSDVASIHGGGRLGLSGKDFVDGASVPAYGAAGLNGYLDIAEYADQSAVILSSIGARCGKCFLVEGAWTSLANTQVIVPNESRVDPTFLWYQLNDESRWHRSGSAQPFIKPSDVKAHRIYLPPFPEQRRIAAILDHADALRAKRRQVLAHLDSLTQSIFHDMFGDSDFESTPLSSAIKWRSGHFLPAKNQKHGPYPVYGGNGINGLHDEYMFDDPRLVVGRVGAYCGAVHVTKPFSWVTDNALIATLLRDDLSLTYLHSALTVANLNQYAGVSGQPSISGGKIGDVRLPTPPLAMQEDFAAQVQRITAQRDAIQQALAADDELFASLQSRAFRGELS